MPFKYSAITANCGNDTLGVKATAAITQQIKTDNLDFCIINCQEVDFNKTQRELQQAVGEDFTVTRTGNMVTRTKADDLNVMIGNTGMASFIICKQGITVSVDSSQEARRDPKAFFGTALNKGGVITNCTLTKDNEPLHLQLISGHLDSNKTMERAQDWGVIQDSIAKPSKDVNNFTDLIKIIPDIRLSGYDANTRSKIIDDKAVNMWETDSYELEGLKQAPLGAGRFSAASTYKSDVEGIETDKAEGKRLGSTKGGMLDFVDVMDAQVRDSTIQQVTVIHPDDPTTKRDHAVVISPTLDSVTHSSDFDKVKHQMASMLDKAAPTLANDLRSLPETDSNKQVLVNVYKKFLSQEGLLNKELQLFTEKLGVVKKASKVGADSEMHVKESLFNSKEPWFADVNINNYVVKAGLIGVRQNLERDNIATVKQGLPNEIRSRSNSNTTVDSTESRALSPSLSEIDTRPTSTGQSISAPASPTANKWALFRAWGNTSPELEQVVPVVPKSRANSAPLDVSLSSRSTYVDFVTRFKAMRELGKPTAGQKKSVSDSSEEESRPSPKKP